MQERLAKPKQLLYCTLEDDRRNAFAVVPANCSTVLVSSGLIHRLQAVPGQAIRQVQEWLALGETDTPSIHDTWGDLPRDAGHFEAFAALLAHVAFVFVVHHELAHLVLGHEAQWQRGRSSALGATASAEDEISFSEAEFLTVAGAAAADDDGSVDGNQALELDADIHALMYTDAHLTELGNELAPGAGQPAADVLGSVWASLLSRETARQFSLAAGAVLGLLSLVPDSGVKELGALGRLSHPHVSLRVLAALNVYAATSKDRRKALSVSAEALQFVLTLFGSLQLAEAAVASFRSVGSATEDSLPTLTSSDLYAHFRLDEALARFDEIGRYVETLAVQMRAYQPSLSAMARARDADRCPWFGREANEPS